MPKINLTQKEKLTIREKEICQLIAYANIRKDIACILGIKQSTVDTHFKNIHLKTNTANAAELLLWVIDNGFRDTPNNK
jgi:DNA-binding CsgD family transcriptional regulator